MFFPEGGPIKIASLRTAQRDGQLAVAKIAGKILTTRAAVEAMTREALGRSPRAACPEVAAPTRSASDRTALRAKIEALVAPDPDGTSRG